jgi:hypothetical protein
MITKMLEYSRLTDEYNINLVYNGAMREDGVKKFASSLKSHLENEVIKSNTAKAVFSVFVEQMTNILMYSAETVSIQHADTSEDVSKGVLVFGEKEGVYFIQTGNAIKNASIEKIRNKIDHINSLDKKELRAYQKERLKANDNEIENPESKGAGLGFIEIAKRASSPIEYNFEPYCEGISYFSLYVEISKKEDKPEKN